MKISIVRGAFLNPFELQNYIPLRKTHDPTAFGSIHPLSEDIGMKFVKLWSPTDLSFPYKYQVLNRVLTDAHYLLGLGKAIEGSDIAHVAETYFHYTHQAIREKLAGRVKKVVSTCWEIIPHNNEGIPGRKEFKKLAYKYIDHFICPTHLAMIALVAEGVDKQKISVVRMGVDLSRFKPKPEEKSKVLRILFVGRMVDEKGVNELLEAYRYCRSRGLSLNLTMIGNGPLKNLALCTGAIVKQVPYSQIHKEYQNADIFCLPSKNTKTWQEQYGMALVEAMACGLPVITSPNGAIPEVCGDAAAYVKNQRELSGAFRKFATDRQLLRKMGQKSLARARKEFDSKKIARQIEKIYHTI